MLSFILSSRKKGEISELIRGALATIKWKVILHKPVKIYILYHSRMPTLINLKRKKKLNLSQAHFKRAHKPVSSFNPLGARVSKCFSFKKQRTDVTSTLWLFYVLHTQVSECLATRHHTAQPPPRPGCRRRALVQIRLEDTAHWGSIAQ